MECTKEKTHSNDLFDEPLSMKGLFAKAATIDPKMAVTNALWARLRGRQVKAVEYDQDLWFKNMADAKPSLFRQFPVPAIPPNKSKVATLDETTQRLMKVLTGSRSQHKYRFRTGRSRSLKYMTIRELMKYWANPRAIVTTTDLHIRDTSIEKVIDVDALSDFNLFPHMHEDTSSLEMMSMVISSEGALTDSHSDDMDISNYCFFGSKLWLAWDTHEGHEAGLDDCDRVEIDEHARFDMKTFLSLKSARWFVVNDGEMLFLPGNMAHRVVTLAPYVGVGAFYLAFPNALRTVSRWQQYAANWELDKSADEIGHSSREEVASFVAKAIKSGPKGLKKKAGAAYSRYALDSWLKAYSQSSRKNWSSAANIADAYDSSP